MVVVGIGTELTGRDVRVDAIDIRDGRLDARGRQRRLVVLVQDHSSRRILLHIITDGGHRRRRYC